MYFLSEFIVKGTTDLKIEVSLRRFRFANAFGVCMTQKKSGDDFTNPVYSGAE